MRAEKLAGGRLNIFNDQGVLVLGPMELDEQDELVAVIMNARREEYTHEYLSAKNGWQACKILGETTHAYDVVTTDGTRMSIPKLRESCLRPRAQWIGEGCP